VFRVCDESAELSGSKNVIAKQSIDMPMQVVDECPGS
jgi:stage III sporulation protein SpoIIIAA